MYGYNPLAIEQLHQARITELRRNASASRAARLRRRARRARNQGLPSN
jgi:hypothetical protein